MYHKESVSQVKYTWAQVMNASKLAITLREFYWGLAIIFRPQWRLRCRIVAFLFSVAVDHQIDKASLFSTVSFVHMILSLFGIAAFTALYFPCPVT